MFLKMIFLSLLLPSLVSSQFRRPPKNQTRHCSSPSGSVDGRIVVEEDGGEILDMTTLTWQVALGSTLCYRSGGDRTRYRVNNCFVLSDSSQRPAAWQAWWRWPTCPWSPSTPSWTPISSPWSTAQSSAYVIVPVGPASVTHKPTCVATQPTVLTTTIPVFSQTDASSSFSNCLPPCAALYRYNMQCTSMASDTLALVTCRCSLPAGRCFVLSDWECRVCLLSLRLSWRMKRGRWWIPGCLVLILTQVCQDLIIHFVHTAQNTTNSITKPSTFPFIGSKFSTQSQIQFNFGDFKSPVSLSWHEAIQSARAWSHTQDQNFTLNLDE